MHRSSDRTSGSHRRIPRRSYCGARPLRAAPGERANWNVRAGPTRRTGWPTQPRRRTVSSPRFTRDSFDLEDSIAAAENLKYTEAIKRVLGDMLARPTQDFVRFIMDHVHGGLKTKARVEKFRGLTKHAFREFINDRINDRLQSALESERDDDDESAPEAAAEAPPGHESNAKSGIVTTEEELQAHSIVMALLQGVVAEDRVHLQDRLHYCNIVLDGSSRKNIVRLRFNGPTKRISIRNEENEEATYVVESAEGIGAHAEAIRARVEGLLK